MILNYSIVLFVSSITLNNILKYIRSNKSSKTIESKNETLSMSYDNDYFNESIDDFESPYKLQNQYSMRSFPSISEFSIGLNRNSSFNKLATELGEFCQSFQIFTKILKFSLGCSVFSLGIYFGSFYLRHHYRLKRS